MWHPTKMFRSKSFTFGDYSVDTRRSVLTFTYTVAFEVGLTKTFTDRLYLPGVSQEAWEKVPKEVLTPTLEALLLMLGINYWCFFPTKNIQIKNFALTREQAQFWDSLYLNGLAEFFYLFKVDFRDLIAFPFDATKTVAPAARVTRPKRALVMNGAGKDSILTAEMLKEAGAPFDYFVFSPTRAHLRVAKLVGVNTISARRKVDPWIKPAFTSAYPSVSTYTFVALLLAELLGYDEIIFSNERSADIGNLTYLGLSVNHQWCKSTEAEHLINDYIRSFIAPDITTRSLLREFSELEIMKRFVRYPKYFYAVTSCNSYFWIGPTAQFFSPTNYWCKECPKCVFLFACFSAFLPKKEVLGIFRGNLYTRRRLLPFFRRILGIEGHKPLDCVGEPEEMILAMHYARERGEYAGEPAMNMFEEHFPPTHDFTSLEKLVFATPQVKAGTAES